MSKSFGRQAPPLGPKSTAIVKKYRQLGGRASLAVAASEAAKEHPEWDSYEDGKVDAKRYLQWTGELR